MGWNAVPDNVPDKRFGQASLEQQARFTPMAYQRVQEEWPWAGVVNTWYLKRATDEWFKQGRPEAYFRLVDPDFTLQPVFQSLKAAIRGESPTMYRGTHSPMHWAVEAEGGWQTVKAMGTPFGEVRQATAPGARLSFRFEGSELRLAPVCPPGMACTGKMRVAVDDLPPVEVGTAQGASAGNQSVAVASDLASGPHQAVIEVIEAPAAIASVVVDRRGAGLPLPVLGAVAGVVALILLILFTVRWIAARRRASRRGVSTYTPPNVFPRPKPVRTPDGER
jgi:hypothetical protein